jgi:hypothetical protein
MWPRAAALITLLAGTPAMAFEVEGFKTGMTYDEVQGIAQGAGYILTKPRTSGWTVYETSASDKQRFGFCRDRLFGYTKPLKDLAAFVRVLHQKTKEAGQGIYGSSFYEGLAANNSVHSMYINWTQDEDAFSLRAQQLDQAQYFYMSWTSKNECAAQASPQTQAPP